MDIKLTDEQLEVINFPLKKGEVLVVEAGAGTGKTTCFIEFSKTRPKDRILYLCFNNKAAKEAQNLYSKNGVGNTKASTVHGLAYQIKANYSKVGKFKNKLSPKDLMKHTKLDLTKCCLILKTIKNFCESEDNKIDFSHLPRMEGIYENISETIFKGTIKEVKQTPNQLELGVIEGGCYNENLKSDIEQNAEIQLQSEIVELSKKVWKMMVDRKSQMPISYDHYLKIYQLSNPLLPYDYILLDEAQDSNPVTLAILESQKQRVKTILIGDKNQAIYGWRGAKDAMGRYESVGSLSLTHSFRFGKNIAKIANKVLKKYQNNPREIKGSKPDDSVITLRSPIKPNELVNQGKTLISRTNATLFEKAIDLANRGQNYHFLGTTKETNWDPSSLYRLNDLKDVYHLWCKNPKSVSNPYISMYGSYENLKKTALGYVEPLPTPNGDYTKSKKKKISSTGDAEVAFLCKLVEKYKHEVPRITKILKENSVGPFSDSVANSGSGNLNGVITLTTAHRAKGLEWDQVEIAEDFLKNTTKLEEKEWIEEHNLLYVAITRAKKQLQIPISIYELIKNKYKENDIDKVPDPPTL